MKFAKVAPSVLLAGALWSAWATPAGAQGAASAAAPASAGRPAAAYPGYYPSQPGTRWTYSSGEIQVLGQPITVKGVQVTPLSHQFGSTTYTQDYLEFRADGSVWLRGVNAGGRLTWYDPPLVVYPPAPLATGRAWASVTGGLRSASRVTGVVPVTVGGRRLNALTIRTETTVAGNTSVQLSYFVPTVGVVRYDTADGSRIDLLR